MGTNSLSTESDGTIADADSVNQYKEAIKGDLVPRNSSGAVEDIIANLGTSTYRWLSGFFKKVLVGESASGISLEDDSGDLIFKVDSAEKLRLYSTGINYSESSGVSLETETSTSLQNVSGLSTDLTVTGFRPVAIFMVALNPHVNNPAAIISLNDGSGGSVSSAKFAVLRDSTLINIASVALVAADDILDDLRNTVPAGAINCIDVGVLGNPGTYTYKIQIAASGGAAEAGIQNCKIVAMEL